MHRGNDVRDGWMMDLIPLEYLTFLSPGKKNLSNSCPPKVVSSYQVIFFNSDEAHLSSIHNVARSSF